MQFKCELLEQIQRMTIMHNKKHKLVQKMLVFILEGKDVMVLGFLGEKYALQALQM